MSDERDQVNFTVDTDAKELAKEKLEHGELSERLRQAVEEIAFGEELSTRAKLEERLADLRDRRDELTAERERITAELEELTGKIERVEDRLDGLQTREDEYEGALGMLEEQLMDGTHIDEGHAQVKKAAHIGGKEAGEVIDDLKERNPSVPDYAFVDMMHARKRWTGTHDQQPAEGESDG